MAMCAARREAGCQRHSCTIPASLHNALQTSAAQDAGGKRCLVCVTPASRHLVIRRYFGPGIVGQAQAQSPGPTSGYPTVWAAPKPGPGHLAELIAPRRHAVRSHAQSALNRRRSAARKSATQGCQLSSSSPAGHRPAAQRGSRAKPRRGAGPIQPLARALWKPGNQQCARRSSGSCRFRRTCTSHVVR